MAVSVNQARNFYIKNRDKFPGMTMTQAVEQMVSSGQLATPPVTAAPAATAPGPAPAPVAVPAPPAPEQTAEPQPKPYMNQYEAALAAYNLENPEGPPPTPAAKGAKVDYADIARRAAKERQRAMLEENVEIARNAKIDPETQKLIDERLERYGIQLTEADKDRQQATWMAVAQAGLKMAQSQSPYFMQALASGMEAGLDGYSEAKAKAAEKKARLQEAKEELSMKAIELRAQAVKDAIAARQAAKQGAVADAELQQKTLAGIVGEQTAGDVIEAASLGNQQTRAQIANIYNTIQNRNATTAIARAKGVGGGEGGIKLSQLNPVINGAISENNRLTEQLNDPVISSQLSAGEKRSMQAKIQSNNQIIEYGRSLQKQKIGMGSGFKILGPA